MPDPQNNQRDRLEQQEFGGDQVHQRLSAADYEFVFACQQDLTEKPMEVTIELLEALILKGWTITSRQRGHHVVIEYVPVHGPVMPHHETDELAVFPPEVEFWAKENLNHLVGGHPCPSSNSPSSRAEDRAGG